MGLDHGLHLQTRAAVEGEEGDTIERVTWCKINAVHGWFMEHCSNGVEDDGLPWFEVSLEQVAGLAATAERILAAHDNGEPWEAVAAESMCPRDGYFFGSTDLDDIYIAKLRTVATDCRIILIAASNAAPAPVELTYWAWW